MDDLCSKCKDYLRSHEHASCYIVHHAVNLRHTGCVRTLIEAGAGVNTKDEKGNTELTLAVINGSAQCVTMLIQAGADVNKRDAHGWTAISLAASGGDDENLKSLLEAGAEVNTQDEDGGTPLLYASQNGQINCVRLLIAAGASVNLQDIAGQTALTRAAECNREQCIDLLIKAGADANTQTEGGKTALWWTAFYGSVYNLRGLIQAGADVNSQDERGETAMIGAAFKGHVECLKLLIQAGADASIADKNRQTALLFAAGYGSNIKCIRFMLKMRFQINIFNSQEHNALQHHILTSQSPWEDKSLDEGICVLLFAAGETIDGTIIFGTDRFGIQIQAAVPDCLLHEDLKLNLKHLCRERIRKHLLSLDPHQHLFGRIPKLGLPSLLEEYLQYDASLDPIAQIGLISHLRTHRK